MGKLEIYQIDAFTKEPFSGNAAAVTFGDKLNREQMFSIAREMNLSETAFLSKSDNADYNLKWFTPAVEVDLCGHATIASLHFLKEQGLLSSGKDIIFETKSGYIKCFYADGFYYMQIPLRRINEFTGNLNEVLDALGISQYDLDGTCPVKILDNGNLYICLKELKTLHVLSPDFKELKRISSESDAKGFALFTLETLEKGNSAHVRYFAPWDGIDEDPVTGSVNGPLLQFLIYNKVMQYEGKPFSVTFEQGDVLNRKGRVGVSFDPVANELFISGHAVTVLKGELSF